MKRFSDFLLILIYIQLMLLPGILMAGSFPTGPATVIIQTKNGMTLVGKVNEVKENIIALQTDFGTLQIPLLNITSVNGDSYTPEKGVVRSYSIELRPDGDVVLQYALPITQASNEEHVQILIDGKVQEVKDSYGHPLAFLTQESQGFTRCTITLPQYLVPSVNLTVLQKNRADIQNQRIEYSFRYVPRSAQTLLVLIQVPETIQIENIEPHPTSQTSQTLIWEKAVNRQETVEISFTGRLNP